MAEFTAGFADQNAGLDRFLVIVRAGKWESEIHRVVTLVNELWTGHDEPEPRYCIEELRSMLAVAINRIIVLEESA